jgi:phosphohistidine phosphatase SixA
MSDRGGLGPGARQPTVIRLYLIRHAAEKKSHGRRILTRRGRRRFRRMARRFAHLGEPIDLVCTSPRSHAKETAALLSVAMGRPAALALEALAPRASVDALFTALETVAGRGSEGIVLVGHHRQFKRLLTRLGVHSGELPLRKGAIVRVDVDGVLAPSVCVPRFRLRPSTGDVEDAFIGLCRVG